MKTLLIVFFGLMTQLAFADAWDNLTREEADAVVAYLEENPYIFNYCDCCDSDGEYATQVFFVKVTSTSIEPSSWDEGSFSVKYEFVPLAEVKYTEAGLDFSAMSPLENLDNDEPIYMNYTWGWNAAKMQATPLFDVIDYSMYGSNHESCKAPFSFPTPKLMKKVSKEKGYKKWYKKNVA